MQRTDTHDYIATTLRNFYVQYMERKRNGRPYKFPTRYQGLDLWRKAAALCLELGADPEQFIAASFSYCSIPIGPMPTMLGGAAARSWWAEWQRMHNTAKAEVRNVLTGETVEVEIEAYRVILDNLKLARQLVHTSKGTQELGSPEALEALTGIAGNSLPEYIRVLLFPSSKEILASCSKDAYPVLKSKRVADAASALGFDVEKAINNILNFNA